METTMNKLTLQISLFLAASISIGLYACSGDEATTGEQPSGGTVGGDTSGTSPGAPTPTAPTAGNNTSSGGPADPPKPPAACGIIEAGGARLPDLNPAACKQCVSTNCCTPMAACYGGAAAGGVDGSTGTKTQCMIFGECSDACNGDIVCEAKCEVDYGNAAGVAWSTVWECVSKNCADFCP
jgi:hypothetical protein